MKVLRRVALGLRPLFLLMLVLFVSGCATPAPDVPGPGPQSASATGIIVIAHGVEARAEGWPLALERDFRELMDAPGLWDVYRVDWYEASLDRLAAPRVGYALGRSIGRELAGDDYDYEVHHLVGHSAGAHVVHGIADALAETPGRADRVIHATFLDPFVGRSLVQLFWGTRKFGSNADFAENYVTREDRVPFTNSLLDAAHNFDLTSILPPNPEGPENFAHMYPITFYRRSDAVGIALSPAARLDAAVSTEAAREMVDTLGERYPKGGQTIPQFGDDE